jgi:hypothetical protein
MSAVRRNCGVPVDSWMIVSLNLKRIQNNLLAFQKSFFVNKQSKSKKVDCQAKYWGVSQLALDFQNYFLYVYLAFYKPRIYNELPCGKPRGIGAKTNGVTHDEAVCIPIPCLDFEYTSESQFHYHFYRPR